MEGEKMHGDTSEAAAKAFPIYEKEDSAPALLKQDLRRLYREIELNVPPGRCRSLALTHLETAGMLAVKQVHQGADPRP